MAKKDAASKRLAKEIAFAELLKKVPPLFTQEELLAAPPALEELPAPPAPEELPALLQLGIPGLGSYGRDAAEKPILDAFKAFGLDHRNLSDWRALVFHLARVLFPRFAHQVRRGNGPASGYASCSPTLLQPSANIPMRPTPSSAHGWKSAIGP